MTVLAVPPDILEEGAYTPAVVVDILEPVVDLHNQEERIVRGKEVLLAVVDTIVQVVAHIVAVRCSVRVPVAVTVLAVALPLLHP